LGDKARRIGRRHWQYKGVNMKDVKVDVRVNVDVDTASVVLLFASAAAAIFLYRQNKQEKLLANSSKDIPQKTV
jgi:hypothetical protein